MSADGGRTWMAAEVDPPGDPHAWQRWSVTWEPAAPGDYELCCRATDASGRRQPTGPRWNLGGYADNDVHRVAVAVTVTG